MSVLETLLPPAVRVAELREHPDDLDLFPEEAAVVAGAVGSRRREFAAVRRCARSALAGLGVARVPLLRDDRGAPCWPAGVVGSMTHCAGYAAAAVAWSATVRAVGIDAEPHDPLPDGVLDVVAGSDEAEAVARLRALRPEVCWDRVLFSAKESVYKAWYPLTGGWLDFEQVHVDLDVATAGFVARLDVPDHGARPLPGRILRGRWAAPGGLLLTAVALDAVRS